MYSSHKITILLQANKKIILPDVGVGNPIDRNHLLNFILNSIHRTRAGMLTVQETSVDSTLDTFDSPKDRKNNNGNRESFLTKEIKELLTD